MRVHAGAGGFGIGGLGHFRAENPVWSRMRGDLHGSIHTDQRAQILLKGIGKNLTASLPLSISLYLLFCVSPSLSHFLCGFPMTFRRQTPHQRFQLDGLLKAPAVRSDIVEPYTRTTQIMTFPTTPPSIYYRRLRSPLLRPYLLRGYWAL